MKNGMIDALANYGKAIKRHGWKAGEPLIEKYGKRFPGFREWAYALGIMVRAREILGET
jgi:hypothetical protein